MCPLAKRTQLLFEYGSEVYYPDFEESVDIVKQFDEELKYVTFKINQYNDCW